jgi:hypothetical protein
MQETSKVAGTVHIVLRDANGNIKQEQILKNIIVAGGLAHIASRMQGVAQAAMGWMGVGTNATAEVVGNTLLGAEVARVATAVSTVTTTQANDTVQHVATFGAGVATGALTEAGIFNVVTANTGLMLNRLTFAVVNKAAGDSLTMTWQIKIA